LPRNTNESEFSHGPRNAVGDDVIVGDDVGVLVLLHLLLHIVGQKYFNFLSVPGCIFLHLFTGFFATYETHVLSPSSPLYGTFAPTLKFPVWLPWNTNESKSSHLPRNAVGDDDTVGDDVGVLVVLQPLLHIVGQKNFNFLPVPDCFFLHLLLGFFATYESHVLSPTLPLYCPLPNRPVWSSW
jgi:hypothetical protein